MKSDYICRSPTRGQVHIDRTAVTPTATTSSDTVRGGRGDLSYQPRRTAGGGDGFAPVGPFLRAGEEAVPPVSVTRALRPWSGRYRSMVS